MSAQSMNPFQNPLRWTRGHQIVWLGISLLGAVLGLLIGFVHSLFFSMSPTSRALVFWLQAPTWYWRWVLYGFFITFVVFYLAQLFRNTN